MAAPKKRVYRYEDGSSTTKPPGKRKGSDPNRAARAAREKAITRKYPRGKASASTNKSSTRTSPAGSKRGLT